MRYIRSNPATFILDDLLFQAAGRPEKNNLFCSAPVQLTNGARIFSRHIVYYKLTVVDELLQMGRQPARVVNHIRRASVLTNTIIPGKTRVSSDLRGNW